MRKAIFIICFISATLTAGAQELDSYKYVIVPAEFEFLKEPNQYELNALTKFLLEKKGYEVYVEGEEGLRNIIGNRCEALLANVKNESGIFVTRLQLVLKNCDNKEIIVSEEGSSRIKDFKQAYHEALRKAIGSIPEKENIVEEAIVSGIPKMDSVQEENRVEGEVVEKTIDTSVESSPEVSQLPDAVPSPDEDRIEFVKGNGKYYLVRTENGYNFHQHGMGEPFAALLKSSSGNGYVYSSITSKGMAQFNEKGNLVVEILNPETNTLETTEYILQD